MSKRSSEEVSDNSDCESSSKLAKTNDGQALSTNSVHYEKIGKDYERFTKICSSTSHYQISESEAIQLLNKIDHNELVIINLPFSEQKVWQFSSVFKTRSAYFPVPPTDFNDYMFSQFKDWCFHSGTRIGCMHRGCNILYNCFLRSNNEGKFHLALYVSLTRFIPKTTISSLFNNSQNNMTLKAIEINGELHALVLNKGLVYYACDSNRDTYLGNDSSSCAIAGYKMLLSKGSNCFELFNRRSTPYSASFSYFRYPPGTFKFSLCNNGDIDIRSNVQLCDDLRLTCPILHRKFNYKLGLHIMDLKLGKFTIEMFKDSIHINRNNTHDFISRMLVLLKCFPLIDSIRSKTEMLAHSRDFYFLYPSSIADTNIFLNTYASTFRELSLLDVSFHVNIEQLELKEDIDSIRMVQSSNANSSSSTVECILAKPILLSADVEQFACPSINEINYILIKPTGNTLARLPQILKTLITYNIRIEGMVSRHINDYEFNMLYPNCLNRVYGADWYSHMTGGKCLIIKTTQGSFEQIRCAAWVIRRESKLPWVKNVIHTASTADERDLMIRLFEADFLPLLTDFVINNVIAF